MSIAHEEQRDKWNKEHESPYALPQMGKRKPSRSVLWFIEFLKAKGFQNALGVEMGCGKGRNSIALAKESFVAAMSGFDFSEVAIAEAKKRAVQESISNKTDFKVMDSILPWDYPSGVFDFGIDCAASTDIETAKGRQFAAQEMSRVLKPGGYLMAFSMSEEDEYHARVRQSSPAEEENAFYHPQTGKFEKVFTAKELDMLYKNFMLVEARRR